MIFELLCILFGVSQGIQPLTTEDGFGFVFSGDKDPSISGVSIDGSSLSESLTTKGGFRLKFIGEEPSVTLSDNIIQNGDLTTSSAGWTESGTFEKGAGRDGTGAISLSLNDRSRQDFRFNESNENSYGIRLSGWSKAVGVDGVEDKGYSLYMDILYKDGTPDWGVTVNVFITTFLITYSLIIKLLYFIVPRWDP